MHQGFFENHDIAIFVNECVYHGLLAVEKTFECSVCDKVFSKDF